MTTKNRPLWHYLALAIGCLSLLWLAGMLYLDFAYGMFPQVFLGGLKILATGYLLLGVLLLPVLFLIRLFRSRQGVSTD